MGFGRFALIAAAVCLAALPVAAAPNKSGNAQKSKAQASAQRSPDYLNCVQYVKQTTDFRLTGDAWRWWDGAAAARFERSKAPQEGAVLVFKRTDRMRSGHVAVVSKVVGPRKIEIDHANWAPRGAGKGKVDKQVSVEDISAKNDWTQVRVWYGPANDFGKPYPTYGFINPKTGKPRPETVTAAVMDEAPELVDLITAFGDAAADAAARQTVAASAEADGSAIPHP